MTGALFLKQEFKKLQKLPKCQKTCLLNNLKVYVGIDSWLILKSPKRLPKRRWDATSVLKYIKKKYIGKKKRFFRVGDRKWQ